RRAGTFGRGGAALCRRRAVPAVPGRRIPADRGRLRCGGDAVRGAAMNPLELFLFPEAWPVLLLVPLTWFVAGAADRRRWRRLGAAAGARAAAVADLSGARSARARRRRGLAVAAVAAAAIAVLQPAWGEGWRRVEQRGVDIVVCLDVSRSMLAGDLPP